jgi:hypothetical protein
MKTLLLTIVSVLSFTAFSQQKIVYLSYEAIENFNGDIFNQVLNHENTSSLITLLKKEFKRNELHAFDGEESISFESNYAVDASYIKNSDEYFHFVGLQGFFDVIDTSYQEIQANGCRTDYHTLINLEGEDSIVYDVTTGEYNTVIISETFCDYYYSFDGLSGIILMDGFDDDNPEEMAKFGIEPNSFYTQNRIGFVKGMDVDFDWNPSNGFEEFKSFVTFSTTIGELEQLTGINLEKTYKKLRKYALKTGTESEEAAAVAGLSVFDISEINELANMFHYNNMFTQKDLHFGITLFNY